MSRRAVWGAALLLAALVHPSCVPKDTSLAPSFRKHVIDPAFRSEGVTVFDVNHDGQLDIVTEELWYEGPAFVPHEVRTPRAWDPLKEYAHCFGAFHQDIDGDGFDDLIVFGPPGEAASWCANPRGDPARHWECHPIAPSASGESPLLSELFEHGPKSLVTGVEPWRVLGWMAPDPDRTDVSDAPWIMHGLTPTGFAQAARYEHGLGVGDLNGDGLLDVLTGSGWLEHPQGDTEGPWRWHPVALCPNDCAHMYTFDIDGDGLADIVGTSPHDYGVRWWQQRPSAPGAEPEFVKHAIDATISQNHAARFEDLDGDGQPDIVVSNKKGLHYFEQE